MRVSRFYQCFMGVPDFVPNWARGFSGCIEMGPACVAAVSSQRFWRNSAAWSQGGRGI